MSSMIAALLAGTLTFNCGLSVRTEEHFKLQIAGDGTKLLTAGEGTRLWTAGDGIRLQIAGEGTALRTAGKAAHRFTSDFRLPERALIYYGLPVMAPNFILPVRAVHRSIMN